MTNSIVNTSGITTGSDGKVRVSGFSSGIDWKNIVDTQVKAKRAPAVQIEAKITKNTTQATAYKDLKTKASAVTKSLDALRAAPGSSTDVFKSKTAAGTTAATPSAPADFVPSGINSLLLTSISSTAQAATHTIRIQQIAAAQQIRSDAYTSTTDTLVSQGVTAGTFSLNGKTITINASDTLQDLRASINSADAGVTATIVSASATSNYLVLTSTKTGVDNEMDFAGGTTTSDNLGLTAAGAVKFELTEAKNAILDVNGITNIERSSNQIEDILTGVSLSLLKAETNTNITLKIEPDLNKVKTAIADFVTAFNAMRDYVTEQRTASDRNEDGTTADDELGPLAYDQRLRDLGNRLGTLAATSVDSNTDGYRSLGQMGITLNEDFKLEIDDTIVDSRLLADVDSVKTLFGLTTSSSDSRVTVLSRTGDTVAGTYYVNIAGTDGSGNITSANIQTTAVTGNGGANDGTATISGQQITGATGSATGLKLFFNGAASLGAVNDVSVTITRGIADLFYDGFNDATKATTGSLDTAVTELLTQNEDYTKRVKDIDTRLETYRAQQEYKFTLMETALAKLESLRSTIDSLFKTDSNSG